MKRKIINTAPSTRMRISKIGVTHRIIFGQLKLCDFAWWYMVWWGGAARWEWLVWEWLDSAAGETSKMLLFQWQCLFVLIAVYPNTPAAVVLVAPPTDQFIDVNSLDNVTFLCNNSNTEDAENPVWQVQGRQIPNTEGDPDRQSFAAIGVFVDVVGNGTTQLTITSGARDSYRTTLDTTTISIQCSVFITASPPRSEVGDLLSVTTFGM